MSCIEKKQIKKEKEGVFASAVGIILNVFLAGFKIVAGAISGVLSVMADGINNLSDCGSSVVSLISFKLASKPADKKHPYGHQRIEYVASMIISFIILIVAVELVKESANKILNPTESVFSLLTLVALIVSICVKLFMFFYQSNLAKK